MSSSLDLEQFLSESTSLHLLAKGQNGSKGLNFCKLIKFVFGLKDRFRPGLSKFLFFATLFQLPVDLLMILLMLKWKICME